jgi:hypothetical protein
MYYHCMFRHNATPCYTNPDPVVLKPNFAPYLSCPSQVLCGNKKSMISRTAGYVSIIMIQELYVVGHF